MGKKLGNLIRAARTDAGLTQAQLAAKVDGATQSDIGRFERGESEPSTQVVKNIAKACGVTQKSLLDAMPKTTAKTSSSAGKTSSSSSSSSGTSIKVSSTEKRLVELYRAADSATRKQAMAVLKGEATATSTSGDFDLQNLDMGSIASSLGSMLGDANIASLIGDALLKK